MKQTRASVRSAAHLHARVLRADARFGEPFVVECGHARDCSSPPPRSATAPPRVDARRGLRIGSDDVVASGTSRMDGDRYRRRRGAAASRPPRRSVGAAGNRTGHLCKQLVRSGDHARPARSTFPSTAATAARLASSLGFFNQALLVRTNAQAFPRVEDDRAPIEGTSRRSCGVSSRPRASKSWALGRLNSLLGLAEIPRELRARRSKLPSYQGLLSEPKREASVAHFLKKTWLELEDVP